MNWYTVQDDNGDFSSVNMDTAVAIRTLEATYKSSADAAAVETMMLRLTEKVQYVFLFVLNHNHLSFIGPY